MQEHKHAGWLADRRRKLLLLLLEAALTPHSDSYEHSYYVTVLGIKFDTGQKVKPEHGTKSQEHMLLHPGATR